MEKMKYDAFLVNLNENENLSFLKERERNEEERMKIVLSSFIFLEEEKERKRKKTFKIKKDIFKNKKRIKIWEQIAGRTLSEHEVKKIKGIGSPLSKGERVLVKNYKIKKLKRKMATESLINYVDIDIDREEIEKEYERECNLNLIILNDPDDNEFVNTLVLN